MKILVILVGLGQLALALGSLALPRILRWSDDTAKLLDTPILGMWNIFIHDVLKVAGTTPPESDATSWKHRAAYYLLFLLVDSLNYPAQAGDWANPGKTLRCWKTGTRVANFHSQWQDHGDFAEDL